MKTIKSTIVPFIQRYPAVLAAYFIYGYYFISTMDFYIAFKKKHLNASQTFEHFDTVLWMWLLAWGLVKIIGLREKLFNREKENLEHKTIIQLKETQIQTLQEVITTLKHQINNPLSVIMGYVRLAQKKNTDPDVGKKLSEIEIAAQRINTSLKEFTLVKQYETIDSPVGNMVQLPSDPLDSRKDK